MKASQYFHLAAFALIILAPILGLFFAAHIKRASSSAARLLGYKVAIASLLLGALAVLPLASLADFSTIRLTNKGAGWLPSRELITGLALGLVCITELPVLLARKKGPFQIAFRRQMKQLSELLPQSRPERAWFAGAGVCAGVCEEFLYRGFLLNYLHVFPWKLDIAITLVFACLVFGAVHLYQGTGAVLQTVLLALGLSVLFLTTRSLLLPIVLHVLINLRVLMVLPKQV